MKSSQSVTRGAYLALELYPKAWCVIESSPNVQFLALAGRNRTGTIFPVRAEMTVPIFQNFWKFLEAVRAKKASKPPHPLCQDNFRNFGDRARAARRASTLAPSYLKRPLWRLLPVAAQVRERPIPGLRKRGQLSVYLIRQIPE